MSIYIKGMEMPKDCIKCPFCLFSDGHWKCLVDGSHADFGGTCRPQRCPLVPVPEPHGRLIDADKFYDAVEQRYRISSGTEHRCERDLLDLICSAPTIIPASEEGET